MDYLLTLQQLREGTAQWLNSILYAISDISGNALVIIIPTVIYWCISKKFGLWMCVNYVLSNTCNQLIKNIACIYRPWIRNESLHIAEIARASATGYSFPSGHTLTAVSLYGGLAMWGRKRRWVVILCAILAVISAFARNWFGAHTLWDVLAAAAVGLLGLFCTWKLLNMPSGRGVPIRVIAVSMLVYGVLFLLFIEYKPYPLDLDAAGNILVDPWEMKTDCYSFGGALIGTGIGWLLEHRYVRFSAKGSIGMRILRGAVGILLTLALYCLLLPALFGKLNAHAYHLLRYAFLCVFIMAGYPALFSFAEKKLHKQA